MDRTMAHSISTRSPGASFHRGRTSGFAFQHLPALGSFVRNVVQGNQAAVEIRNTRPFVRSQAANSVRAGCLDFLQKYSPLDLFAFAAIEDQLTAGRNRSSPIGRRCGELAA